MASGQKVINPLTFYSNSISHPILIGLLEAFAFTVSVIAEHDEQTVAFEGSDIANYFPHLKKKYKIPSNLLGTGTQMVLIFEGQVMPLPFREGFFA